MQRGPKNNCTKYAAWSRMVTSVVVVVVAVVDLE